MAFEFDPTRPRYYCAYRNAPTSRWLRQPQARRCDGSDDGSTLLQGYADSARGGR
jgi:hypothetical protein